MHALVIGGGVAGAATAVALRSIGVDVTICEARSRDAKDAGLWLGVASNGLNALQALGLRDVVLDASLVDPRTGAGGRSGSAPIRRADLYGLLRDAAVAGGARIAHDRKLVAADSAAGHVVARFADGSALSGDLLIGCDGIHSRTRSIIDPEAPSPRYIPLLNVGGFSTGADAPGEPARLQFVPGKKGFFGYTTSADRREAWWFANLPWATEPSRDELAAATRASLSGTLLQTFADAPPHVRDMIRATRTELYALPTYDLPGVPTWWRDNMIIIGDAAHATTPTSGQGASLALEDAVVLAKCLRDLPTWPEAAVRYERLRRERVEGVVALSARASSTKLTDASIEHSLEWVHTYRVDWTTPV
ncbi:MAG: FAD-dependent monooxygenase [Actinoallomurus sp.]